jgi:hypothetical protein
MWLVDIVHGQVLRYAEPAAGVYRVQEAIDRSRPTPLPGLTGCAIDLSTLF